MNAKDNWLANLRHIVDTMPSKNLRQAYLMVSEASGLGVEYIYQLYEGKPTATGKKRYPGNKAVEAIRTTFGKGKPPNWMDLPPTTVTSANTRSISDLDWLNKILDEKFQGNQAAMARAFNRQPAQINQYLKGRRNIGADFREHVRTVLGTSARTEWPFRLFSPDEYYSLPKKDLEEIEDLAYGKIGRLKQIRRA
jgi:transcriptional regulator with XRE-family HTH domain